ncbi:cell wall-binding repeat-containing protein [Leifsonia poae]|uniref:cell wall-binding repeat-containing protein n=1 Tax=Leifsonia poae TaxID=110933 RepID=UPI001CBD0FB2|nr:cell wall-binding repeat-containing protein [Leifsonia poae]
MNTNTRTLSVAAAALAVVLGLFGVESSASAAAIPTDSPSATSATGDVQPNPSLSEQNAVGDHAMGSTIAAQTQSGSGVKRFAAAAAAVGAPSGLPGLDVSGWQTNVNWAQVAANGAKFAYVKATESTDYTSSQFSQQYDGSYNAGLIRGAYHFAHPNDSSGAAQATYFVQHGGGWSNDGRTLPPLLDIEYGTDGTGTCWGMSQGAMVSWISSFTSTMLSLTGRYPAIYTTTDWWTTCTGNSAAFTNDPLFIARYPSSTTNSPGTLPAGWANWTMWQWADAGVFPGDQDVFNGTQAGLQALASPVSTISDAPTSRLAGADAFGTSAAISASTYSPGVSAVYIATRTAFPDALSAGAAAGKARGPVLLVTPTSIPSPTAVELARLKPQKIIIVGGTTAISPAVMSALARYTTGSVTRLAGADRFETSAAISASTFAPGVPVAYIATGGNFPDALSGAAAAAGSANGPMLLVQPWTISPQVAAELVRLRPAKIVVLGGTTAINPAVASQLTKYSSQVVRLAGADRFDTSVAIAQATYPSTVSTLYIATGLDYPDALSGAPAAGLNRVPILLVTPASVPASVVAAIKRFNPANIVILGGTTAVTVAVQAAL